MTLLDFIKALKTKNVKVTVSDDSDDIITFYSEGINGVESDVSSRNVKKWEITGAAAINVILEAAI